MREFKTRRSKQQEVLRFLAGCGGVILLGGLAFLAVRGTWGMYQKFTDAATESGAAQSDLSTLTAQEAQVSAEVTDLSTSRGIEGEIRERYGVGRPGEGEIEIVRPSTTTPVAPGAGEGFWGRVLHAVWPW